MRILILLTFLTISTLAFAQPVNDDCDGLIDLGVVPFCNTTVFDNIGATESNIGYTNIPDCWANGSVDNDVWFKYTASDTIIDYTITLTGVTGPGGEPPIFGPQVAIYRGECIFDELAILACYNANPTESELKFNLVGLDLGEMYFIRINGVIAEGAFQLCIEEQEPITTIDLGGTTTQCEGILYDTGGPDGNYGANEDFTYSICPSFPSDQCVTFNLEYYHLEYLDAYSGGADQLIFYDGPDTNSPIIPYSSVDQNFIFGVTEQGSVCQTIQASSGCLTVQFISNGETEYEGFAGNWICSAVACEDLNAIEITEGASYEQIAENLTSNGTFVTVDTIICDNTAFGTFENGLSTDIGLDKGLLLSSGAVLDAVGPNNAGFVSNVLGTPGDEDLNILSNLSSNYSESNDACVVELSVFANTPKLTFEYTFGSEEYPEFAEPDDFAFNDIFTFLVSGPGINGIPELNNQQNLAVLPSGEPVEIQSVNYYNNWEYYRDNWDGPSVQYDAMTSDYLGIKKTLTAQTTVIPCNTYKIKLAIADRGDAAYDSGVFIGEITTGLPTTQLINADGLDYFVEGCSNSGSVLNIILSEPFSDTTFLSLVPSGDALIGTDYNMNIPSPLFVVPGQTVLSLPIDIIDDTVDEGTESMNFALQIDYGCGAVTIDSVASSISDVPLVEIMTEDSLVICANETVPLEVSGAVNYQWQPDQFFDPDSASVVIFSPTQTGWYTVEGSIGNVPSCIDTDSVFVTVPPTPEVNIIASGPLQLCTGETVDLTAQNNLNDQGLVWTSNAPIADPSDPIQVVAPEFTSTYVVTLQIASCVDSDSVEVQFNDYSYPDLLVDDTTICQGDFLLLSSPATASSTIYDWSPADLVLEPDQSSTFANTDTSGTFQITLSAASADNFCGDTTTIDVTIDQIELSFAQETPVGICLGEMIELEAIYEPLSANFEWTSSSPISNPNSAIITVEPNMDDYFVATVSTGACELTDSIFVNVGELPDFELSLFPEKEFYCFGDQVILQSDPNIDEGFYQGITYEWQLPAPGVNSDPNAENLSITVGGDFDYVRITNFNGCIDTSFIHVELQELDPLVITGDDTICEGGSTQLSATQGMNVVDDWFWLPENSLDDNDIPNPVASPNGTTTYTLGTRVNDCYQETSYTVNVVQLPDVDMPTDTDICPGEAITLNNDIDGDYVYEWTASPLDPSLVSSDPNPSVMPNQMTTYFLNMSNPECPDLDTSISISIIENVELMIDPSEIDICDGDTVTLSAITNYAGTYLWQPGDETTEDIQVTPNDTVVYTVQYDYGCGVLTSTATVNVLTPYPAGILCDPDETTFEEGAQINVSPDSIFTTATYSWDNGTNGTTAVYQAIEAGEQPITMNVLYNGLCEYSFTKNITVIPATFTMPNAFTPDGDGQNDFFKVSTEAEIQVVDFKIWNRWGQQVYGNENGSSGWDGYFQSKPAASDVYLFEVTFIRPNGREEMFVGDVTLIR